jgi:arylformamidase
MTTLWRQWDREGLDAQFTLDGVPDLEGLFARRLEASARARLAYQGLRGVAYGEGPGENLDLYRPEGAQDAPVQLFIHGGFWRSLDAATFAFMADGFVPAGAVTVVIDYPLIPAVRLADIVASCRRAVAWVWHNVHRHGGDPARFFISGNSAGGHLVALLMDRAWPPSLGLPEDVVAGGCALSGLYELEPVRRSAQNDTLLLTEEEVRTLSPMRRLPERAGPLILAVGGEETEEFRRQTEEYAQAWRRAGHAATTLVEPGRNHIDIVTAGLARPGSALNRAVLAQMGLD